MYTGSRNADGFANEQGRLSVVNFQNTGCLQLAHWGSGKSESEVIS